MKEYEFTPEQSAEKLMEFIRDMVDDEEHIEQEKEYVTKLFDELQKSEKFEILAHYFDLMFMDSAFNAFNEMNNTSYSSVEEIQEMYSKAEIFQSWLEYEGIYGYTAKILHVLEILENKELL